MKRSKSEGKNLSTDSGMIIKTLIFSLYLFLIIFPYIFLEFTSN